MNDQIIFVDEKRREEIDALRMQAYAKAAGFSVNLETLRWKRSDDESYVMAAERDGKILSTMRGEIIDSVELLEKKLECPWDFPIPLELPALLLSRAATVDSERASGLNLVLRYWFLRLAEAHGIRSVIGTFVSGSPRENTLRVMGYEFFENRLGWQQSTYRSLAPVTVATLDLRTRGEQARAYCLERMQRGNHAFRFAGRFPERKIVRCL